MPCGTEHSRVRSRLIAVILILALGLLLYGYTLSYPFVFDDYIYLVDNPLMKNLRSFVWMGDFSMFANYSKNQGLDPDLSTNLILRPATYITFYFNYLLDGMNPRGFRAVNIVIHLTNALLLFLIVSRVLRTSRKHNQTPVFSTNFIALGTALLFLAHPLQIESVTYIVQRFTSLGTLFYLLTVWTYLQANAAGDTRAARWLRAASLASLVTGMFSKEFLFTAPFMLILLDWLVMGSPLQTVFRRALPYLFCLPLIPVLIIFTAVAQHTDSTTLSAAFNITNGNGIPQYHYALTQLSVILTYLRLLLIPVGLNLDWDYPLTTSFWQGGPMVSTAVFGGILLAGWYLYRRYGQDVRYALLFYSILWFFMTLMIDSSIVPLPDLLAEHRTYLPSIGFLCALACGADVFRSRYCNRPRWRYVIPALMVAWILTLAIATNLRQQVWHSEISIWKDTTSKSPNKFRPWFNLGTAYAEHEQPLEAITCYRKALLLQPSYFVGYRNLGRVYNNLGRHREALDTLLMGVWLVPNDHEQHYELGRAYEGLGQTRQGKRELLTALQLCPSYRQAHLLLSILCTKLKEYDEALAHLKTAATLQPLDPTQHQFASQLTYMATSTTSTVP